jgi:general stress protein YciG
MTGKEDSNVMTEKKRRGFSAMDESKKREIARKGGIAAHRKGTAHKFTSEEAREAGRKGGRSAHRQGRAHKFTPEEARAAGRKGGMASHAPEKMPETPMPSKEPPMQPSSDLVPAASEEPMI